MDRIKFQSTSQRDFIKKIMDDSGCPSLRELSRRIDVNYSTMKNYYSEKRLLSKKVYDLLLSFSQIPSFEFEVSILEENWGQRKGGKCKKSGPAKN